MAYIRTYKDCRIVCTNGIYKFYNKYNQVSKEYDNMKELLHDIQIGNFIMCRSYDELK